MLMLGIFSLYSLKTVKYAQKTPHRTSRKYHIINRGVAQMHIFKELAEAEAYKQGYSQHMIAKVLGLNQATVQRIIKRTKV